MKKIIFLIIILPLLFGTVSFAQETKLPSPGLTPDSLFYFLDTFGERLGMFFTFGAEKKAEKAMKYAEEKLAEVKAMTEQNKLEALEKANQKYQEFLGLANRKVKEAKEKGRDVEELATLIIEKTLQHQEVLLEVFEKVSEEAKTAIQKAIEVSRKGSEEAVRAVTGAKKEELQKKIEEVKTKVETADWKTYKNEKYGYSFKYPPDCFYGPMPVYCKEKPPEERPSECLCFLDSQDPNRVFLQAFTGEKDNLTLADFSVSHYETSWYNPPPDTNLIEWLKEKFSNLHEDIPDKPNMEIDGIPAVKIYTPASSMAFSGEGIYFIKNDMLFEISMLDVDSESNKELYKQILSTFKFIEIEEVKKEIPKVPISCQDSLDCSSQMKCENSVCVDVGCIKESGMGPSAGINPQWLEHLPTECCEGLKSIAYSGNYDENCNFKPLVGVPTGVCSKCGNGICEKWETKCNCPEDCLPAPAVPNVPMMLDIDVSTTAGKPYTIGWKAISEATNYILERDTNLSFSNPVIVSSRTLNSFSGTLSPSVSTRYYFRVKACNKYGCSSWSKLTSLWVEACPLPKSPSLANLGAPVKSGTVYTIVWSPAPPEVEGIPSEVLQYTLQRDTNLTFSNPTIIYKGASNSVKDSPLPRETTTYFYRVRAENVCGNSPWSNIVGMQVIVPSITVTSPNGGERFDQGANITITWDSKGVDYVDIDLLDWGRKQEDGSVPFILDLATNYSASKGTYAWKIYSDWPTGNLYKIRVASSDNLIKDTSDNYFSIVAPGTPSITVTSPNGGEVWKTGETRRITWDSVGVDSVHIYITDPSILGSGSTNYIKPDGVPVPAEAGYYNWTIPVFHWLPGSGVDNFKIRIFDASNATIQDYSDDFFSIMPNPPLTLISPNGGEILVKGTTYTIRWDGSSFYGGASIQINLIDGSVSPKEEMAITKTTNTGSYTWTVPETIKSGSLFKIGIYVDEAGPGKYDLSDNAFSILPSPPPEP